MSAFFLPDLAERRALFTYLQASYVGGIKYKYGLDARGESVLVEHENETTGIISGAYVFPAGQAKASSQPENQTVANRFRRRQRIAAYENNVRPILDKIAAYIMGNTPERDDKLQDEVQRLKLSDVIASVLSKGLQFQETWVGWDTADLGVQGGEELPQSEVTLKDPVNKGKPYLIEVDPRRVVDFEEVAGVIMRVVFEETVTIKDSLDQPSVTKVTYKEWTPVEWVIYEQVAEQAPTPGTTPTAPVVTTITSLGTTAPPTTKIKEVKRGNHKFGCCPWIRFRPSFPTEDLCEVNRALFNIASLLDEELYNCTFTQRYILGAKSEEIKGATAGTGNFFVVENPEAILGVIGAIPGQSTALMDRIADLRNSIYAIVNMENTATKNVAETAEKKKRDLEALYTMLVKITAEVERIENDLLEGMGILEGKRASRYGREFDVYSIQELMDEINGLAEMPFVPPQFKRRMTGQLMQKLDPFGDHEVNRKAMEEMFDISPKLIETVATLKRESMLTPDMFTSVTGLPQKFVTEFVGLYNGPHPTQLDANGDPILDDQGNPITDPPNPSKPPARTPKSGTQGDTAPGQGEGA